MTHATMTLRILILLAAAGCAFGQAPENTKTAKINEIFRLTNVDQMQKQAMSQIQAITSAQMAQSGLSPEAQEQGRANTQRMLAMVSEKMSWDKLRPAFVKMYDETFNEDEISGLLMFYQSNAGAAMINKMPALQMRMMALVQDQMKTLVPEIQKIAKEAGKPGQ
jgi:hypothetical protein